ncbi:hypothetical protein [Xenorhabdus entomophaga]|uniref:hypothetical protein n=1 Tax=Xenorhabdus entomophaga TaxID=3136257 RepID=UPI0030F49892
MVLTLAYPIISGWLKVRLSGNSRFGDNSLITPFVLTLETGNIEMSRVVKVTASDKSMGYSDGLKNKQTPYLQSGDHWFRRNSSLVTELH